MGNSQQKTRFIYRGELPNDKINLDNNVPIDLVERLHYMPKEGIALNIRLQSIEELRYMKRDCFPSRCCLVHDISEEFDSIIPANTFIIYKSLYNNRPLSRNLIDILDKKHLLITLLIDNNYIYRCKWIYANYVLIACPDKYLIEFKKYFIDEIQQKIGIWSLPLVRTNKITDLKAHYRKGVRDIKIEQVRLMMKEDIVKCDSVNVLIKNIINLKHGFYTRLINNIYYISNDCPADGEYDCAIFYMDDDKYNQLLITISDKTIFDKKQYSLIDNLLSENKSDDI